jgi:hypothetical protein
MTEEPRHAPRLLETQCEWTAETVGGEDAWTERFTPGELAEIDAAVRHAQSVTSDLLEIGAEDFPLPTLSLRLKRIEHDLINGRGFVRLRGIDRGRYDNDAMCLIYWGIGLHLGKPWAQNRHGHLLGDVTDQGKSWDDPTVRGNELGGIRLGYHCDGSDLIGLMCLKNGVSGGLSAVANSVAIHNALVRERPDLAAELYQPQPYDFRGEQKPGARAWYTVPVFTDWGGRLFVRVISAYILASQRHADAPRLTDAAREGLRFIDDAAESGRYSVMMGFEPGDMQFVNNYHVLHGRTAYVDDRPSGRVRHLKRLWLETEALADRPPWFRNTIDSHWNQKRVISRLDAVG